jgi:hypothetical protein
MRRIASQWRRDLSPADIAIIRERFVRWIEDHPCDGETFWYVQNCVGDLIDWTERPSTWIDDETLARRGSEIRDY